MIFVYLNELLLVNSDSSDFSASTDAESWNIQNFSITVYLRIIVVTVMVTVNITDFGLYGFDGEPRKLMLSSLSAPVLHETKSQGPNSGIDE